MKKLLLLNIVFFLHSCSLYKQDFVSMNVAQKETLVTIYSKTQDYGVIEFLRYIDNKYQLLVYSYRVDLKQNTSVCTLRSNEFYELDDQRLNKDWMTMSMLQEQKYYEKYFNCFTFGFMDLSNEEKIKILDDIASRE